MKRKHVKCKWCITRGIPVSKYPLTTRSADNIGTCELEITSIGTYLTY